MLREPSYNVRKTSDEKSDMATKMKSRIRSEQEAPMGKMTIRVAIAHERHCRKMGGGEVSDYVRQLIEQDMQGFTERRKGPSDRRKKRK